jgi:hypothetical protein
MRPARITTVTSSVRRREVYFILLQRPFRGSPQPTQNLEWDGLLKPHRLHVIGPPRGDRRATFIPIRIMENSMMPPNPSSRTGSARLNVAETVFVLTVEN